MKRTILNMILIPVLALMLTHCGSGGDSAAFDRERDLYVQRYDSLEAMVEDRIENLKAAGTGTTAMDENALHQEMAQWEQLKTQLATEKDNLMVASAKNWSHYRDSLDQNLIAIRDNYFPEPE